MSQGNAFGSNNRSGPSNAPFNEKADYFDTKQFSTLPQQQDQSAHENSIHQPALPSLYQAQTVPQRQNTAESSDSDASVTSEVNKVRRKKSNVQSEIKRELNHLSYVVEDLLLLPNAAEELKSYHKKLFDFRRVVARETSDKLAQHFDRME